MNYNISFQELANMQKQILSKQLPVTLDNAKKQVEMIKQKSLKVFKKKMK